jgi:hypothetical protein
MFSETSEDLPLFSGQDYGPQDKGPFVPKEVHTQGSLLDMRPTVGNTSPVCAECGVNETEPGYRCCPSRWSTNKEIANEVRIAAVRGWNRGSQEWADDSYTQETQS